MNDEFLYIVVSISCYWDTRDSNYKIYFLTGYRTITIKMEFGIWSSSTISDRCMCVWCLKRLCKCFVYRKSSSIFWCFLHWIFHSIFFLNVFDIINIDVKRWPNNISKELLMNFNKIVECICFLCGFGCRQIRSKSKSIKIQCYFNKASNRIEYLR